MKSKLGLLKTLFNKLSKSSIKQSVLIWPSILVLLGLIVYPLGAIILQSIFPQLFSQGFHPFSLKSFTSIFSQNYTYHSILNAILFGLGAAAVSAALGTFFAILVHRKWVYGQKFINIVIWLIFFTPSYLVAEGWVLMLEDKGVVDVLFNLPNGTFSWFFSPYGLIVAMGCRLFPVVYLSVKAGLNGLGSDFENAARTQGASTVRVWRKIILPLLMPAILAGATLTFAESASDYGFAAAFVPTAHIPMLTYSIYVALGQMPVDFSQVGALSLVLIGIIALAIWSQKLILSRGSYSIIQNQIRPFRVDYSPSIGWSICAYIVLFIVFAVPIGGEIATSFMNNSALGFKASNISFVHYHNVLTGSTFQAILRSLKLSLGVSIIVTILGVVFGFVINQNNNFQTKLLFVLTMSTLAIPGIVLAAGYIFAWNAPFLVPFHLNFYGMLFCLFLAYIAGSLPNSIRLQMAALLQISPSLINAGRIHGAKNVQIFQKIIFPLVSSTMVSVLFLTFSGVMFELPASQLLYPPGQEVLPVVISNFYKNFQIEDGAALTVVGILLVLVVYGLGQLIIYLVKVSQKALLMHSIKNKPHLTRETLKTLNNQGVKSVK
jgi:iron(III) transport system permease protein